MKLELITYNCCGLKDYKKLKRTINTCANIIKMNTFSLIFLQETHLDIEATRKLNIMWRGQFSLSPGSEVSRGCITLFDSEWEVQEKY